MTPLHPEDRVTPDPCNSFILSADGTSRQPADPKDFCLLSQAQLIVQTMRYEGCIPMDTPVQIIDEAGSIGQVVYGDDGRKVYLIIWAEPNPKDAENPFAFQENAGQLSFEFKNFPPGHGDWRKNMAAGDIERIGLTGGETSPTGRPGKTVIS